MKKSLPILLMTIVLIALVWAGMGWLRHDSLEVAYPTRGSAVLAVYATGTVEATVMLPLSARGTARLMSLSVDEGVSVKKGQVLARLESDDLKSILEQMRANEHLAEQDLERQTALFKRRVTSEAALDKANAAWDAAKAAVRKAQSDLEMTTLTAPADGLILKRDGEIGQMIPSGQAIFWMSCCAPLRISVEVNEEDIVQVKPEQEVLIRADAFPDQVFKGKVQSITPKGDPISRTYRVRVEFVDDVPLQIGMTAETNIIITKNENALLVPSTAVSDHKLWLVRDGKLVQQEIKQGAKGLKETEIISGVHDKDTVVIMPSTTLKVGASVRTHFAKSKNTLESP
jgi:multidrug efflux system membrane fusion protein